MNLQEYANIYASFHGSSSWQVVKNEILVIPLQDISWEKSIVLKLRNFDKIFKSNTPFSSSLMRFFKMETNTTIFSTDDSWSILLSNKKLVYPSPMGRTFLCATPNFVCRPEAFKLHMKKLKALCFSENVWYFQNAVVYLDDRDIPFPGGNYFDSKNVKQETFRVCFITNDVVENFNLDFLNNVTQTMLHRMKPAVGYISKFIDAKPQPKSNLNTNYYEETNLVKLDQSLKNPDFILHDILDSLPEIVPDLGIVIEEPIIIAHQGCRSDVNSQQQTFYAFAINCHIPKNIIYVPLPYDRYYRYTRHMPFGVHWTSLYYDNETLPSDFEIVVLEKNILGLVYRGTFFCLRYPKLVDHYLVKNVNTKSLFNTLSFDLKNDMDFSIVSSSRYDAFHTLYCVKNKNINYEMWCLSREEPQLSNPKRIEPPYLVNEWCRLVTSVKTNFDYGDLKIIKLMFVLSQHDICFKLRKTSLSRRIQYDKEKDIIFHVGKNVIDFINDMRLFEDAEIENSESCSVS